MNAKLLSINNYHYRRGGSDAMYFVHAEMFSAAGWDTAFFSMHHPTNYSSEWSQYFIEELEFGESYSLTRKATMAAKVIYSWEARNKLSSLLQHFKPDVAHVHCIYHHISPSILPMLQERNIPVIYTAHDLKLACPAYKMLNNTGICEKCIKGNYFHLVKNRCIHNSLATSTLVAAESFIHKALKLYRNNLDAIVVPSHFFGKKLIEWGWPEELITYIPNFIDSNKFTPTYSAGNYFLYFGRLAPEKGIDTLINAAKQTEIELKIAGTGPYEQQLKQIAADSNNIQFLGYQSGDELWKLISNARAVVLPSEWYENAPVSVLEAYALGKPVIGADIGGIPEMLLHDQTGKIFKSGNREALAEALNQIQQLPDDSVADLGKNAREYVSTNYTANRYFDEMNSLYKRFIPAV